MIGDGPVRAAGVGLPGRLLLGGRAPGAGAVAAGAGRAIAPDLLRPAAAHAAVAGQRGTADRGDERRRGRELHAVAAVARRGGDGHAGVVVVRVERGAGGLGAAVAVGDEPGAELDRLVYRGAEAGVRAVVRLDQQNVTVRADRRDHVQVQADLLGPARIGRRQAAAARLADLREAAAGHGAGGQAVLGP